MPPSQMPVLPAQPPQPAPPPPPNRQMNRRAGTPPAGEREPNNNDHQRPTPGQTNNAETFGKKRANITIASLNMCGSSAPTNNMNTIDKWTMINHTIRKNKIAILALQETHLDDNLVESIKRCFGKNFDLLYSSDPDNPRTKAGVAFVLNKALIPNREPNLHVLVPGRAIMLKIKWPEDKDIKIINIYAPVQDHKQPAFWAKIETERRMKNLSRPDFLLGDFNITEELIDRSPPSADNRVATDTLRDIRLSWEVQDQWRHDHPNETLYTCRSMRDRKISLSRLDRIYIARKHTQLVFEWRAEPSAVPTDHWLVSCKFAPKDAPLIGSGRWTWYLPSLDEKPLIDKVITQGKKLQKKLEDLESGATTRDETNPQILWMNFKESLQKTAKETANKARLKITSRLKRLEKDRKELMNDPNFDWEEDVRTRENHLAHEIKHLQSSEARKNRENTRAAIAHHGEKIGGIWSAINKEKKPRDLIRRLKTPGTTHQYERSSVRMAELAREYHNNLQYDAPLPTEEERVAQIEAALEEIPNTQKLNDPENSPMGRLITEGCVTKALKLAKNGSTTGMDGCPYELWKKLKQRYDTDSKAGGKGFDIIKVLTIVYQDIQTHGVEERSDFALGWMCPIYKKKDRTEISNYRPITLLNTDYKILTRALATQLMNDIETMIHSDQAGFIPNRCIYNQIRLASTIVNYAEATEEDGAIVALDQEKAYDKVKHDYLWATLENLHIPPTFTNTVKALYQHAHTQVAINGILSTPFRVTRGVRQGDPLSCALFDLAIEPLACKIRNDPNIQGISIPGTEEKIKICLFADDTNLYLNKDDRMDLVQGILNNWCRASGARFNLGKTEIIPFGTEAHRNQVATIRKINPRDNSPFDEHIRIARDGEAVQILGARIGNRTNEETPWEPIIDKAQRALESWNRFHPTLKGRKLIIQMTVGGLTQFLTKAQGMPQRIEDALTKITRDFIWHDSTRPRIALKTLFRPIEEGGLNLLDINARNEAIEITWLRTYLDLSPERPTWAKLTDILIDAAAPKHTNPKARFNTFIQTWNPSTRGERAKILNKETLRMIKTAQKYKLTFTAMRLSPHLKSLLPAWYHPGAERRPMNNAVTKCLIQNHQVKTIADTLRMTARLRNPMHPRPHEHNQWCLCHDCVQDRIRTGCKDPNKCATEALETIHTIFPKMNPLHQGGWHGNLSLTSSRKQMNLQARNQNQLITFDPTITAKNDLTECFRIFTEPSRQSKNPAQRRVTPGTGLRHATTEVYTDGACINNGKENAKSGSGIWFGPNDPRNSAIRVPGDHQSNQAGETVAIIKAVMSTPTFCPLEIVSDSKYAIDRLTTNLTHWENKGWIRIKNAKLFQKAAHLLRQRTAITSFKWVKGHQGNLGNEESDKLAKEGAEKDRPDLIDLQVPDEYLTQGAKLHALNQATAYQGIRQIKSAKEPPIAAELISQTRDTVEQFTKERETNETIWMSLRKPILRTRVQQFLYKTLHQTHMVGSVWGHIPGFGHRKYCTTCHNVDSMEHILARCPVNTREIIWNLAKQTWPHDQTQWPEISLGIILGIGCINIPWQRGPPEQPARPYHDPLRTPAKPRGASRLLQILISEAAHLVWVMRCERVIQNKQHTDSETKARWLRAINERLTCDRITATKIKRDARYTNLIKHTWGPVLQKQRNIPLDWIHRREVLVGSGNVN